MQTMDSNYCIQCMHCTGITLSRRFLLNELDKSKLILDHRKLLLCKELPQTAKPTLIEQIIYIQYMPSFVKIE